MTHPDHDVHAGVSIRGLNVHTGTTPLLHDINLDAEPGEIVVILGRSGAGKSTLLRALSGLTPATGSVRIDGREVNALPPHRRPIAMMLDTPSLFTHMTVRDNIRLSRSRRLRTEHSVDVAMLSLGIDHLANRHPHRLSTGQQQKVALARALVRVPTVLCLDEPLAHVDTYASGQLKAEIIHTHRRLGCTTFYVTHDLDEAFSVADQMVYLSGGRIMQIGTPADLRERPATLEVARHLRASIFLPAHGTITHDRFGAATARVCLLGQHLNVPACDTLTPGTHDLVVIGYPDSATADPTGRRARQLLGALGQVTDNIYMGAFHHVGVETIAGRITVHTQPDSDAAMTAAGDEVEINLDATRLWALPAETAAPRPPAS
ncbi:Fe(3+) ions import ATP-binding protein FbpC 2 [Dermatophilus congolensis]|uniref:Fe(3+) ions import ATP-binding protein FbpC 2 n=1 Tax=Dermatophilus congolensis TaxID=1863 RepID=A0A239V4T1_9MICO|nr:ABC transporter ATP-binding protein [Dermatophilus congolensis]SNV17082.1 Fe(3+) ions import ATP-binding protein FbpC 2 [Dermatophilus congolensis]